MSGLFVCTAGTTKENEVKCAEVETVAVFKMLSIETIESIVKKYKRIYTEM